MRLAVLSDIHGNLAALETVLLDVRLRAVDAVVNLGDSLSGPLLPRETAELLMAQSWPQLAGNHERQILAVPDGEAGESDTYAYSTLGAPHFAWLRTLRPAAAFDSEIFLCHGTPKSDLQYLLESVDPGGLRAASADEIEARLSGQQSPLVLCGHSHVPRAVRSARGQLIVNPGSVGLPAFDARRPHPHVVENRSPDARYAIVEKRAGLFSAELRSVPYDHESMVKLALLRRRDDWAHALRTGYALAAGA
jgi:predicted phosphodiesterase